MPALTSMRSSRITERTEGPPGGVRDRGHARRAAVGPLRLVAGALTIIAAACADAVGEEARGDSQTKGLAFEVTCAASVRSEPITTRVYVLLGPDRSSLEPRFGPNWFRPQPFFALDVANWKPSQPLRIDSRAEGFPVALNELAPGRYAIQAVVRLNR